MSGGLKLPVSHCETEAICGIQFGVYNAQQLKQFGVCHVTSSLSYNIQGEPIPNGLADRRMGSTELRVACETCSMEHPDCPGHFGYTELAEAVFNIGLFDVTYQAMSCICQNCSQLLVPLEERDKLRQANMGIDRLRLAKQLKRNKCEQSVAGKGCGHDQAKIRKPPPKVRQGLYMIADRANQETILYASDVYKILKHIPDEDAILMGFRPEFCHPRDLIMTVLPIPPPPVRPGVSFGSARSENELTVQLASVLKVNEKLRQAKDSNAPRNTLITDIKRLQELISCFINNASTYYNAGKLRGKLPLKSLTERLKGKQGRLRGYLMGKRVDFSARTVITGDPTIDVDQVGVPRSVAMTLTIPEKVNHINRKWLTGLVQSTTYPSANYVIHKNGATRDLRRMKTVARKKYSVEIGDTVERHLQDGDPVLFNRQPTLHRMSMMGHRAKVLPFNTFRLNLTCTTPYNADFDGDEMNLHVPQSLLTKAELIEMMMVTKNFVTPNKSQPCMGIVQDSLLGCFRVTDRETFLDKYFMQCVILWLTKDRQILPVPAILKPQPLWTGKQLFSLVLPEVNVGRSEDHTFKHDDSELLIRRGHLISGMINKSVVGVSPGSLIHVIYNEKGADEVVRFVNAVQRTTAYFLYNYSFSVGIQDTIVTKSVIDVTDTIMKDAEYNARTAAAAVSEGTFKTKPGMSLLESFENESNQILNNARKDSADKVMASVQRTNAFRSMSLAGSKGSNLNICQIAVQVGQQNVNGKRIPFHFRRRTLPHLTKDDYLPTSRGLVKNGFVAGLTPFEFVFHTMGGREGLIDTACKTAETGYLQRKLIKSMEDIHIAYDGTVRNATREVIQFTYGEDGLDGHRIEPNQRLDVCRYESKQMEKIFKYEYGADGAFDTDFGGDYMTPRLKQVLRSNSSTLGVLDEEFNNILRDRETMRKIVPELTEKISAYLPVNVDRLIHNAQAFYGVGRKSQQSSLNPVNVIEGVDRLQKDIRQLFSSYSKRPGNVFDNKICEDRINNAVQFFCLHLRTMLASKRVLNDYRLNETAFNYLLSEIRLKFLQSIIAAGEAVGAIAAQSCGEPATQMTLNTFHNAGISSKNVTLGVPRLLELLNVSKHQRVSNMVIPLVPEYATKEKAGVALHQIESSTLLGLTNSWSIVYDPDPLHSVLDYDNQIRSHEWDVEQRTPEMDLMSPWVARIELDMKTVKLKLAASNDAFMETIKIMLANKFPEFDVQTSTDLQVRARIGCLIRLRLKDRDHAAEPIGYLRERIPIILQQTHVKGIPGITKVFTQEKKTVIVNPETGGLSKTVIWFLDTEGTALREVMGNVMDEQGRPIVEAHGTSSNNIPEINHVLGIEAARLKLLQEMREVYVNYDIRINHRQYSLLVDTMCHRGYIMAVSRTGINKISSVGPLMKCSFEETVNVLMGAAAFGEFDPVRGVSASVALGKQARIGTGIFDLILNTDLLRDAVPQKEATEVGRNANIYAGASTIAYRRAAEAENNARGGGGGGGATPLFDRSVIHPHHARAGGMNNNNLGGGGSMSYGGGAGTATSRNNTGGATGGTHQTSTGSGHGAVPSAPHYSGGYQQQQQGGFSASPATGGLLASSTYYNQHATQQQNNNSMLMSSVAYNTNNNAAGGGGGVPQIFLPPGPSTGRGTQQHQSQQQQGSSSGNLSAVPSSAYHPIASQDSSMMNQSMPPDWTSQFGNKGAFNFESADYSAVGGGGSSRGIGGAGGSSGGAGGSSRRTGSSFQSGSSQSMSQARSSDFNGGGSSSYGPGNRSGGAAGGSGQTQQHQPGYLSNRSGGNRSNRSGGSGSGLGVQGGSAFMNTNQQQQMMNLGGGASSQPQQQLGRAAMAVAPVFDSASYQQQPQQPQQQQQQQQPAGFRMPQQQGQQFNSAGYEQQPQNQQQSQQQQQQGSRSGRGSNTQSSVGSHDFSPQGSNQG